VVAIDGYGTNSLLSNYRIILNSISISSAYGSSTLTVSGVTVGANSINSASSYGSQSMLPGRITLLINSLSSESDYGNSLIIAGAILITPVGISSTASYGTSVLEFGNINIVFDDGIASLSSFGNSELYSRITLQSNSINESFATGTNNILAGAVNLIHNSISSGSAIGGHVVNSTYVILANSKESVSSFGLSNIQSTYNIIQSSVLSDFAAGLPTLKATFLVIINDGIPSEESIAEPHIVIGAVYLGVTSISSGAVVANPSIYSIAYINPNGIASILSIGSIKLKMPAIPAQITSMFVWNPCVSSVRFTQSEGSIERLPMIVSRVTMSESISFIEQSDSESEIVFL
jgi:hypothetical protein